MCRRGHKVTILYIYHIPKADSYMAHARFPLKSWIQPFLSIITENMTSAPPFLPHSTSPVFFTNTHMVFISSLLISSVSSSSVAPSFNSSSLSFFSSPFLFHSSHQSIFFSVSIHKSLLTSPLTCHSLPISQLDLNLCASTSNLPSSLSPSIPFAQPPFFPNSPSFRSNRKPQRVKQNNPPRESFPGYYLSNGY